MTRPSIISVAITGSVPRKRDNPALPVTVPEQIESTHAAYEAGATLVHVHVRNDDETSSSDPDKFAAFLEGVRRHCPDMIVQFSTGGRGRALEQRGSMLHLRPDMASLATGSVNFPTIVYENPPDFVRDLATRMRDLGIKPEIEVFDLAMLYNTADLVTEGLIMPPPHVQFVFGVKHALPAHRDILEFEVAKLHELLPGATWTAAGIGRHQFEVAQWALELGGHCRTGLEDNIRMDRDTLAPLQCGIGGTCRRNGGSSRSLCGERARGSLHSRPASGHRPACCRGCKERMISRQTSTWKLEESFESATTSALFSCRWKFNLRRSPLRQLELMVTVSLSISRRHSASPIWR